MAHGQRSISLPGGADEDSCVPVLGFAGRAFFFGVMSNTYPASGNRYSVRTRLSSLTKRSRARLL